MALKDAGAKKMELSEQEMVQDLDHDEAVVQLRQAIQGEKGRLANGGSSTVGPEDDTQMEGVMGFDPPPCHSAQ